MLDMFGLTRQNFISLITYAFYALVSLMICSSSYAYSAPKTLLVLGDSLSAEYGLARGTGWVALLEQRLQQKKINYQVINASISGETTSGGKARLAALLKTHQPAIVIIELGGNDALRGLDLKVSEQNFRSMIKMVQASTTNDSKQSIKAKPLLLGMQIPPNYGKAYTDAFFSIYGRVAKETHTALVPFFLQGVADQPALFQADRIHLKAEAHPTMLDNVWPTLDKLLKGTTK
jgi:acyl-CoA thioesterase I